MQRWNALFSLHRWYKLVEYLKGINNNLTYKYLSCLLLREEPWSIETGISIIFTNYVEINL